MADLGGGKLKVFSGEEMPVGSKPHFQTASFPSLQIKCQQKKTRESFQIIVLGKDLKKSSFDSVLARSFCFLNNYRNSKALLFNKV